MVFYAAGVVKLGGIAEYDARPSTTQFGLEPNLQQNFRHFSQ